MSVNDPRDDTPAVHRSPHALAMTEAVVGMLGVDGGAAVVLSGPDVRSVVYSTDATAVRLDQLQFDLAEGPCLDAYRANEPVVVADIGDPGSTRRWPAFAPAAAELGVGAVQAVPLALDGVPFGVLELHSAATWTPRQRPLEQAVNLAAAAATWVLADHRARALPDADPDSGESPGTAGAGVELGEQRGLVHRAAGVLSVRRGVSVDDALAMLRAEAFSGSTGLDVVAQRLLADLDGRGGA